MLNGKEYIFSDNEKAIAITSMVKVNDQIWCGLTGDSKALVSFDINEKCFKDNVKVFPWVEERPQRVLSKIHNALCKLDDGRLVIGEGILFTWNGIPFEATSDANMELVNNRMTEEGLPLKENEDVGPTDLASFDMRSLDGGKILIYSPETDNIEHIAQIQRFNYVQSMIVDTKRMMAYGHTIGGRHFFTVDLINKKFEDHGPISAFAFHNLVIAPSGIVYGGWIDLCKSDTQNLRLLRFDPAKGFLERLPIVLLDDVGPTVQGNTGIDQWLVHSSGDIYVGMVGDGCLYKFDEDELTLEEIGPAGPGGRVTSLDEDEKGRIIFSGGFPKMHIGRYDPVSNELEDLGPITDKFDHIYFHGSVYDDGVLYVGETDSGVASLWEIKLPE